MILLPLFEACAKSPNYNCEICEICGLCGLMFIFLILFFSDLFNLAWLIIGTIRLSDDKICEQENATLYNAVLAAVIIGFIGIFFSAIRQCCK